jgi:hypothetical protein
VTRRVCSFLGVVVAISAAACSGSSASMPTSPSSVRGAQITGRVSGVSLASTAPLTSRGMTLVTQASTTTGAIKVSVNGTNIETNVDGTGHFTLNGVPSGTIVLNFSGRGINASVTLRGVNTGDQIDIDVSLNGGSARVDGERRNGDDQGEDDDDDDHDGDGDGLIEVTGAVSNLGGTCPSLRFMVGSRSVKTSSTTAFEDIRCGGIQNTTRVEVKGRLDAADGLLAATRVEGED